MDIVLILVTILWVAALIIDWFIVMGKNPRSWKGGKKHGKH